MQVDRTFTLRIYVKHKQYYINSQWNYHVYENRNSDMISFSDLNPIIFHSNLLIYILLIHIFKPQSETNALSKSCAELSLVGSMGGTHSTIKSSKWQIVTFNLTKCESLFYKINTFLQKTTTCIVLQAEQIFIVNIQYIFSQFRVWLLQFLFYVISKCSSF